MVQLLHVAGTMQETRFSTRAAQGQAWKAETSDLGETVAPTFPSLYTPNTSQDLPATMFDCI